MSWHFVLQAKELEQKENKIISDMYCVHHNYVSGQYEIYQQKITMLI